MFHQITYTRQADTTTHFLLQIISAECKNLALDQYMWHGLKQQCSTLLKNESRRMANTNLSVIYHLSHVWKMVKRFLPFIMWILLCIKCNFTFLELCPNNFKYSQKLLQMLKLNIRITQIKRILIFLNLPFVY